MSEVPKIKRLGSYVADHLELPVPDWLKERLGKRVGQDVALELLAHIERIVKEYDLVMKGFASEIKERAKEIGIQMIDYSRSCHKKKNWCGTCLSNLYGGRYKTHYPYWKMKIEAKENDKKNGWRTVRDYQLKDILRQILNEEEVESYFLINQLRIDYIIVHNYLKLRLQKDGLVEEIDFE